MPDQNQKSKFANNKSGIRNSLSILSRLTGHNANILILDDANNAIESDEEREKKNMRYSAVLSTRLNNPDTDKILAVAQRTNMNDISGYMLNNDPDVTHLMLPLEFEKARKCKTIILPSTAPKKWEDPRTVEKEPLCPTRFNPKAIDNLKRGLVSAYLIAGQLQQRPAPAEGGMFKKSWFQWWKKDVPPKVFHVIQSWDTAFKKEEKRKSNQKISYSVCTTWGLFDDEHGFTNLILLNMWRERVEYPELRAAAIKIAEDYRYNGTTDITADGKHTPDMILIESKATGDPLNQDLRRAGIHTTLFDPSLLGDKIRRASLITHVPQSGRIWVPARAPYYIHLKPFAETFVECCANFPNDDESKDVVDTLSQVLHKLLKGNVIKHPSDPKIVERKQEIVHYGVR
jgi:predicted phage terminase large subunit-like protein